MKKKTFFIFIILILIISCDSFSNEPIKSFTKIFGVKQIDFYKNQLFYADINSLEEFKKTENVIEGFPFLFIADKYDLLLVATRKNLYFIDTQTKLLKNRLDINYIGKTGDFVFPIISFENLNDNFCLMVFNAHIYLVNLSNLKIAKKIFDANLLSENTLIHCARIDNNKKYLYLMTMEEHNAKTFNYKIVKTDLSTGKILNIFQLPKMQDELYFELVDDYALILNFLDNTLLSYSLKTDKIFNEIQLEKSNWSKELNKIDNKILLYNITKKEHYLGEPETLELQPYFQNNYRSLIKYQNHNGKVIAFFNDNDSNVCIIDLNKKNEIIKLKNNNNLFNLCIKE